MMAHPQSVSGLTDFFAAPRKRSVTQELETPVEHVESRVVISVETKITMRQKLRLLSFGWVKSKLIRPRSHRRSVAVFPVAFKGD